MTPAQLSASTHILLSSTRGPESPAQALTEDRDYREETGVSQPDTSESEPQLCLQDV